MGAASAAPTIFEPPDPNIGHSGPCEPLKNDFFGDFLNALKTTLDESFDVFGLLGDLHS